MFSGHVLRRSKELRVYSHPTVNVLIQMGLTTTNFQDRLRRRFRTIWYFFKNKMPALSLILGCHVAHLFIYIIYILCLIIYLYLKGHAQV